MREYFICDGMGDMRGRLGREGEDGRRGEGESWVLNEGFCGRGWGEAWLRRGGEMAVCCAVAVLGSLEGR